MKSFEDELNDAIQKAFQDSFENFEKKPQASLDQKIYNILFGRPFWKRPLVIWSAAGLLLLAGFGVIKLTGTSTRLQSADHFKPTKNEANRKSETTERRSKSLTKSDPLPNTESNSIAGLADPENSGKAAKPIKNSDIPNTIHTRNKQKKIEPQNIPDVLLPLGTALSEKAEKDPTAVVQDQSAYRIHVEPLPNSSAGPIPVTMSLPEIGHAYVTQETSALLPAARSVRKKLDIPRYDPSRAKSFSWLVNVAATNTFQSIYLLPNAESRILKVSFPNSVSNLGYKVSAGIQMQGFQVRLNYSHLSWKAEYVYAIDEFKADEYPNKKYVFERLGTAQTVTSKLDMAGIGIKKQLDFKGQHVGRIFGQFGLDYSRSLQPGSKDFISGTISAGKIIKVNEKTELIVGPYFEYNFKKVPTAEYSIKVRPNQLGVSVGLRINKN